MSLATSCRLGLGRRVVVVAAASLLLTVAAGCGETPESVGARFMELYFVEIDQVRAQPLTAGPAAAKLADELKLVEGIRRTYSADQARPTIYFERKSADASGDHARQSYEVRIQQGGDETRRTVLLTLERRDGHWRVGNFVVEEPGARPTPR